MINNNVKKWFLFWFFSFLTFLVLFNSPNTNSPSLKDPIPQPKIEEPKDPELRGIQVPIPKEIRRYNISGSQCVWCTAEMLGTYHHVERLNGLTKQYKHATGPGEFAKVMNSKNVKFKQINDKKGIDFIEEWVAIKKMGVGIGINGSHAILVCHFERNKLIKIIDNSDKSLKIQTWEWNKFYRQFDGWAFVILPDNYPEIIDYEKNNWDNGKVYY